MEKPRNSKTGFPFVASCANACREAELESVATTWMLQLKFSCLLHSLQFLEMEKWRHWVLFGVLKLHRCSHRSFSGSNGNDDSKMLESGELVSGRSTLLLEGSAIGTGEVLCLPPDKEVSIGVENSQAQGLRHLAVVTGDKPVLLVKVNTLDHNVTATAVEISDNIFGTTTDLVNM
jgi:hypothetical protein